MKITRPRKTRPQRLRAPRPTRQCVEEVVAELREWDAPGRPVRSLFPSLIEDVEPFQPDNPEREDT
jgi:hypothetical protein